MAQNLQITLPSVTIPQDGELIIRFYGKNSSSYYFDDLSITTRKTITTEKFDLIQADDYYPYGLAIQGNMWISYNCWDNFFKPLNVNLSYGKKEI